MSTQTATRVPSFAESVDANLLLCIVRSFELTGFPPSWDDMCRATGHARQLTWQRLNQLRDAGLIAWTPEIGKGTLHPLVTEASFTRNEVA